MDVLMKESELQDVDEIVAFHNAAYGDNRKLEHWMWEYKGNDPSLSVFTVIKNGERIVATQGMMPYYIKVQGKRFLFAKSENTLLHPKYRGGTLFQDFYDYAASLCLSRGMQCIWGYTPAVKALRRFGFRVYEDVMYDSISTLSLKRVLARVSDNNVRTAKRVIKSIKVIALWVFSSIFRSTRRISDKGLSIKECLANKRDLENLYQRLRTYHPSLIHIDLDEKYLGWRICGHPIFKYKTYFVYEGDLLRAYAIVNTYNRDRAYLTDFTLETVNAGEFLLKQLLHQLCADDIGYISFLGNVRNPTIKRTFQLLRRFGFVRRPTGMNFVLRNLTFDDESTLFEVENWYMNGLWTEGYGR